MPRLETLLLSGLICLCISTHANSQGVMVGRDGAKLSGFGEVNVEKTLDHWSARERTNITSRINLQIELLTAVCQLDERDTTRLRLAAEGVAAKRLTTGRRQLEQFVYDSELAARDDAVSEDDGLPDQDDALRPYGAALLGNGIVEIQTEFEKPLMEHPLWQKMLQASLSEEQRLRYEDSCRTRNRGFLSTAATLAVADFDTDVFLSDRQREQIHAHAVEMLSPQVTTLRPASIRQAQALTKPVFDEVGNFQEFLRPSQMERLLDLRRNPPRPAVRWGPGPKH